MARTFRSAPRPALADTPAEPVRRRRLVLGFAAAAVLLASIDTYVVVLALPAIMRDVGISLDRLQQATPIISGFLLGYVVVMPTLGRLSDVYGRAPLLIGCLAVFMAGSLVTASAHDLGIAVTGRALQGLGGGGLVPVTLAVVADRWPATRRGAPLGVVGGVQEMGSVVGPLYGGLILSVATWQTIFWLNIPLAGMCAAGIAVAARRRSAARTRFTIRRVAAAGLASIATLAAGLAVAAPEPLRDSVSIGVIYTPLLGQAWLTPLTALAVVAIFGSIVWALEPRSLVELPGRLATLARRADLAGATLAALTLTTVVLSFAGVDPGRDVVAPSARWLLPAGLVCAVLFLWHEHRASNPLLPLREFARRAAAGAMLTNLAIGAALMAALVDVPIFARLTVYPDSQLSAALVLLRLLVGVPVGAVAGGVLSQRAGNRAVATAGMLLVAAALALMTRWSATTLADPFGPSWLHASDAELFACGLGFGLAIAPVNAAMLAAVRPTLHGLAGALVVVARLTGMLVGISVLTAVGLHVFYTNAAMLPSPESLCPRNPLNCAAYNLLAEDAVINELRTVFLGAAVCAAVAALTAFALLSRTHAERSDAHV